MFKKDNIKLIVIATVCLVIGLSAPAIGHGVHAKFAHNAHKVDGKHAAQIGVNGLERVSNSSAFNSDSPKSVTATCPAGKILVGTGFDMNGGKSGASPNVQTDVVMDQVFAGANTVIVQAYEDVAIGTSWSVRATAICALAP